MLPSPDQSSTPAADQRVTREPRENHEKQISLPAIPKRKQIKLEARNSASFQSFVTQRAFLGSEYLLRRLCNNHNLSIPHRSKPFQEKDIAQYFSSNLPTLGFTLSHPNKEMVLVAMAAAKLRKEHKGIANVVFLPPYCLGSLYTKKSKDIDRLYTRRGIVVDENGDWREGRFAIPVRVDIVGTFSGSDNLGLQRAEKLGIPFLNDTNAFTKGKDKRQNKLLLEKLKISSPASLLIDDESENWKHSVERFIAQHENSEVVVKPTSGSHGNGVVFHCSGQIESIESTVRKLLAADSPGVIIDERIPSYPLQSKVGNRQDWNIRLLVGQYGVIDSEVRVINWGKIVNKAKGAHIEELKDVLIRAGLSDHDIENITAKVDAIGVAIAQELKANYLGIDLILSPDKELFVIEINSGAVGGLVSLAEIRPADQMLLAPSHFLEQLAEDPLFKNFKPVPRSKGEVHELISDPFEHAKVRAELNTYFERHSLSQKPKKRPGGVAKG